MFGRIQSGRRTAEARRFMPGGVNSPVRSFTAVKSDPVIIRKARGSRLFDVDGNDYIDYVCSWGPLILGHAHPAVVEALCHAAAGGTSFGLTCEKEIELARMLCEAVPSVELVRMVTSGTEATMSAVRLARASTGRNLIVTFEGCYHGHGDSFLIQAGSGMLTAGVPASPGVPDALAALTICAPYNDTRAIGEIFDRYGADIAAVIVEPVAGNMGMVRPEDGFLSALRNLTSAAGSLLIFDEVITGFRLRYGAWQDTAGVRPDLTTFGKIIGGGLPVGAYGGRQDLMAQVAPEGDVYQAGTLAGNPVAMAAGVATLRQLQDPQVYADIERMAQSLEEKARTAIARHGVPCLISRLGSMFSVFFTDTPVSDLQSARRCDTDCYARFHQELLRQGVFFPPSQFETCFVSRAHTQRDIEATAAALDCALERLSR